MKKMLDVPSKLCLYRFAFSFNFVVKFSNSWKRASISSYSGSFVSIIHCEIVSPVHVHVDWGAWSVTFSMSRGT